MNAGKILLGGVIAMATGAALGVLFAPDKGSATGKKVSVQPTRYPAGVSEAAVEFGGMLEDTYDFVNGTAVELTDNTRDTADVLVGQESGNHAYRM